MPEEANVENLETPASSVKTRERRPQKKDAKLNRLEELRQARESGKKNKYKVEEIRPVYDLVSEEEYSKIVSDRQTDNFVDVVEGISEEYYDDGREIFDDEINDAGIERLKKGLQKGKNHGKKASEKTSEKTSEKGETKEKPAVRSGDIRNMFAAAHSKQKKEPESSPIIPVRETLLEDILGQLNGDVSEPKQRSRSDILGLEGTSVEEILASDVHEGIFTKSIMKKKVKSTKTTIDSEPSSSHSSNEPTSSTLRKRALPESPIKKETLEDKKETLEEAKLRISAPKIAKYNFVDKQSNNKPPNNKPSVSCPIVDKWKRQKSIATTQPSIEWGDESYDLSNASYEVDSSINTSLTTQDIKNVSALDDGWSPDVIGTVSELDDGWTLEEDGGLNLDDDPVMFHPSPVTRTFPKIDKKWDQTFGQGNIKREIEICTEQISGIQTNSQGGLQIYWLDACEDLVTKGCIYLFGKMYRNKATVSICVKVTGIERRLFFLLRKQKYDLDNKKELEDVVSYEDVENEFQDRIKPKFGIKSRHRHLRTTKLYAFDKADVPDSGEYLEVRYSFSEPMLPEDLFGETFSHVFGRNTSALEIFLLDRKIRGPCWLTIQNATIPSANATWCAEERIVVGPSNVTLSPSQPEPPKIIIAVIQLKIVVDPRTKQNEIASAAVLVHRNFPLNTAAPNQICQENLVILSESGNRRFPMRFREDIQNSKQYKVTTVNGEKLLLEDLMKHIELIDPDLLVFHDAVGYQLDILLHRLSFQLKGFTWSRLGRLKRKDMPKGRNAGAQAAVGRLVCDVKHSAQELIHTKSYDLTELVRVVLKESNARQEIESDMVAEMFQSKERLEMLIDNTLMDALYTLRIMAELNAIPLALQITNIAGNVMSRTLLGGRSERNEFLLLHAFTGRNYICPDKHFPEFHKKEIKTGAKKKPVKIESIDEDESENLNTALADEEKENPMDELTIQAETTAQTTSGKRKPAYAGGLVLEPKKGLYNTYVLLMDFNSLYPSIIQEYNICFTTIDRQAMAKASKQEDYFPEVVSESIKPGILPAEIKILVDRRREVKKLIKEEEEKAKRTNIVSGKLVELDIRQKALKLTANSMYGCLGFTMSRFFARPLAALITMKGREILMSTKELIEKQNLDVIYGDTDSVMIDTHSLDWDAVQKMGMQIKMSVDKHYKSLQLGVDGVFRSLLLLQKKKYAALVATRKDGVMQYTCELKGLDIVRRDWSQLAADSGTFVIDQILSEQPRDIVLGNILTGLKNIGEFMKTESRQASLFDIFGKQKYFACLNELDLFVITKQLTKDPSLYADVKSLPHVQVAQRMNKSTTSTRKFKAGDTIAYVICNEIPPFVALVSGKKVPHTQRGYHIDELMNNPTSLSIDKQYYLAEQVHKVVNRLCEPIDGIDAVVIAEYLGVDKSQFPSYFVDHTAEEDETAKGFVSDVELYRDCLPLILPCPGCRNNWTFDDPICEKEEERWLSLKKCPFCDVYPGMSLDKILNCLRIQIGLAIQRYYKPSFICQDAGCHYQCSFVPPKFHRGQPVCPACEKNILKAEYSDRDLYLQLCFWRNAFDPQRALDKVKSKSWQAPLLNSLKQDIDLTAIYQILANYVQTFLDRSSYGQVNFSDFFSSSLQ